MLEGMSGGRLDMGQMLTRGRVRERGVAWGRGRGLGVAWGRGRGPFFSGSTFVHAEIAISDWEGT